MDSSSQIDLVSAKYLEKRVCIVSIYLFPPLPCHDVPFEQWLSELEFKNYCVNWPVNSPYKGPAKREMFPFEDVIMEYTGWSHEALVGRFQGDRTCILFVIYSPEID